MLPPKPFLHHRIPHIEPITQTRQKMTASTTNLVTDACHDIERLDNEPFWSSTISASALLLQGTLMPAPEPTCRFSVQMIRWDDNKDETVEDLKCLSTQRDWPHCAFAAGSALPAGATRETDVTPTDTKTD